MCMFFVWMLVCYVDVLCVDSGWLYQYIVCRYWMDMQLFLDDTRWMRLFFVDIGWLHNIILHCSIWTWID